MRHHCLWHSAISPTATHSPATSYHYNEDKGVQTPIVSARQLYSMAIFLSSITEPIPLQMHILEVCSANKCHTGATHAWKMWILIENQPTNWLEFHLSLKFPYKRLSSTVIVWKCETHTKCNYTAKGPNGMYLELTYDFTQMHSITRIL